MQKLILEIFTMNIKSELIKIANKLDEIKLYTDADVLTKIAQFLPDSPTGNHCPHENIEYTGNDGEREAGRECYGECSDCGETFTAWETIDGGDEDGPSYSRSSEWIPDSSLPPLPKKIMDDEQSIQNFSPEQSDYLNWLKQNGKE